MMPSIGKKGVFFSGNGTERRRAELMMTLESGQETNRSLQHVCQSHGGLPGNAFVMQEKKHREIQNPGLSFLGPSRNDSRPSPGVL
jgi:hypothetical protein